MIKKHKQLLDYHIEIRRYWRLKEEAPYHILWRPYFRRVYGLVRQKRHGGSDDVIII
jgi:hypothetical protein